MIEMMVRREDVRQHPPRVPQFLADDLTVRRVDGCGHARGPVMDQDAEIVASAGKLADFECRHDFTSQLLLKDT